MIEKEGANVRQHNLIRSVAYDLLKSNSSVWEEAERQAADLWLNDYEPKADASNLEKVRGHLEAFEHYFVVKDWNKANELLSIQLETGKSLYMQLSTWSYFQELISLHSRSLLLAREFGDRFGEAVNLGSLGNAHHNLGNYQLAIDCHQKHLKIVQELNNLQSEASALGNLGNGYKVLGQYEQALNCYQQSLEIAQETGNRRREAYNLGNLGNIHYDLGQYEQALNCYQLCLSISQEISDRRSEGMALSQSGNVYIELGNYKRARRCHQEHLTISQEVGDRLGEGVALGNLGITYERQGKYTQAAEYAQQHINIAREIKDKRGEGSGLRELGVALLKQLSTSDANKVLEYFQSALSIFQKIGIRREEAETLKNLAELYKALNQIETARRYAYSALNLAEELKLFLQTECKL